MRSFTKTAGVTLIETLVALTILGTTLLLTMALLALEPRASARIGAHAEALRVLEREAELMRAGIWTPEVGEHVLDVKLPEDSTLDLVEVSYLRKERPRRGLAELTLTANYRIGDAIFERRIKTMIFGY